MTENQQWRDMRHRLYDHGARCLWAYEPGELDGTPFGLECFATHRGPVIFQIWPDAGFEVFHTGSGAKLRGSAKRTATPMVKCGEPLQFAWTFTGQRPSSWTILRRGAAPGNDVPENCLTDPPAGAHPAHLRTGRFPL